MQRRSGRSTDARIGGTVTGQIAAGEHLLELGAAHGDAVYPAMEPGQVAAEPLPLPVMQRPRPFLGLLDREDELDAAARALQEGQAVEFQGEFGVGKSALLQRLAYSAEVAAFPDGVVYLSAFGQQEADLLLDLFDSFYRRAPGARPTDAEIRPAMQGKRALILLDDVRMPRPEVEALMGAMPHSAFVLATEERRLGDTGKSIPLHGLPTREALALLERELDRPLTAEELPEARVICEALGGHPRRLLQAAAAIRERVRSLASIATAVHTSTPEVSLLAHIIGSLSEPQRRVLITLAALGGAPTGAEHVALISDDVAAATDLEVLERLRLVQAHDERYRLPDLPDGALPEAQELTAWRARALDHCVSWAEANRGSAAAILGEADALLAMVDCGAAAARWSEVLRLVRAVEAPLTLDGRWQVWEAAVRRGLEAARASGDRGGEAWALHQLGTRALCRGDRDQARELLNQALRLRQSLRDHSGAAATERNLDVASGYLPSAEVEPSSPLAMVATTLKVAVIVGLLLGGGIVAGRSWLGSPKLVAVEAAPGEVEGGVQVSVTVRLNKPAPTGGADVGLVSSHDVVPVPERVTVPAGKRSASVSVTTHQVLEATAVTLMGSRGDRFEAAQLRVVPRPFDIQLSDLQFAPSSVAGGSPVQVTVDLDRPAPREGVVAVHSSDVKVATVRSTVDVPAGARQFNFRLDTAVVDRDTPVTVTVAYGGGVASGRLKVLAGPARLAALDLTKATAAKGETVEGQLVLSGRAPAGGLSIGLSPSSSAVLVPPVVTIPADQSRGTFSVTVGEVERRETVTLLASLPGSPSVAKTLVVVPEPPHLLSAVEVRPAQVVGGRVAAVVVRLAAAAPDAVTIALSSDSPSVTIPATVTVARGKREARVRLVSEPVAESTQVTITAIDGEVTKQTQVGLVPPHAELVDLTLSPARLTAGGSVVGVVTLDSEAPEGGVTIALSANNPRVQLPDQVTVPAGRLSADFRLEVAPGATRPLSVRITATRGQVSRTASLAVGRVGPRLATIIGQPAEVRGGSHVAVLVRLTDIAPNGAAVALSTNRSEVMVPATVRIKPGAKEVTVAVETRQVTASVTVTITASYEDEAKSATVVVSPEPSPLDVPVPSVSRGTSPADGTFPWRR